MRFKNIFFPLIMLTLGFLTFLKYKEIKTFHEQSKDYTFIVSANQSKISSIKENLQNYTYQTVYEEKLEEGNYKITVKCPPDKIKFINKIVDKLLGPED